MIVSGRLLPATPHFEAAPLMNRLGIAVVLFLLGSPALGQTIVNGSLTGPTGYSVLPTGWSDLLPDCDTEDASGIHEVHVLSPDGGTFVSGAHATTQAPLGVEAFEQSVSGFTAGIEYTIYFYQSNLGYGTHNAGGAWGAQANWQLYIDGEATGLYSDAMAPTTGSLPNNVWSASSITFTATASAHALGFGPHSVDGLNTFLGIDGIVLSPSTASAPATLSGIKALY
jgi:hypothetical protein